MVVVGGAVEVKLDPEYISCYFEQKVMLIYSLQTDCLLLKCQGLSKVGNKKSC